ncbi:uncharacterized protein LOC119083287 isoform X2 [Bradysia coprophila]|uniref:uncharacterized protein LOC119083287 isoform X2 n=1 Tax=Bradysia coprophila TaxID=38358 RepID=UPI00187D8D1F|nr:uncharacterized protein LOC119083287 isoform X2 [Bradysia coprophila]
MDFPIKREVGEPAENFILSTSEHEHITAPFRLECSKKGIIVSQNGFIKKEIKQEPKNNYDNDHSEFDEEYLDEDSETEYTQEASQTHTRESNSCGKNRQARTSPAQIQKLADFMNNKGKQPDSDEALRILTDELNAIGPPIRTTAQWRRTWSIMKYNNKRKRRAVLDESETSKRLRLDQNDDADATNSTSSKTHDTNEEDIPNTNDHFHSEMVKAMNSVLQQQTKQTIQLEKLNKNLEKLIGVLAEKIT